MLRSPESRQKHRKTSFVNSCSCGLVELILIKLMNEYEVCIARSALEAAVSRILRVNNCPCQSAGYDEKYVEDLNIVLS